MGYGIKKTSDVNERCEKKYGGKYSLIIPTETVEYNSMVLCECNIHKEKKYVNLRHFLAGDSCGCRDCIQEKKRANEKENYIKKFVEQWGEGYTFDKLDYKTWKDSGVITCKMHGDFILDEIRYAFDRTPCPVCRELECKKNRNEEYLSRLKEKYGEQYVWLTTDFGDYYKDYVDFICPIHGNVSKTLCSLLNTDDEDGLACPKCINERKKIKLSYTLEDAIAKAKKIESCKYYDFSNITEWHGVKEICTFKCKKHGDTFQQTFDSILNGHHNACPSCIKEMQDKVHKERALTNEEFKDKVKEIYGDIFDLSHVNYVNNRTRVTIICQKHGPFDVIPGNFLFKIGGCPKCSESSLETEMRVFLDRNNIEYIQQKSLRDLTGKMKGTQPQRDDFFLPKYNACIECQGGQHFSPVKIRSNMSDETANKNFEKCLSNDRFKYDSLCDSGFDVVYFTKSWLKESDITGWYDDKKCFYKASSLLEYFSSSDCINVRIDWYDKNKYILVPFKKTVKTVWNEETCREEAKKYKTRIEFYKANKTAYGYACKNKWIDSYDWFIELRHKWTYDECYNEAKKYETNVAFDRACPNACSAAREKGWIKDYTWFKKLKGFWTYERCYEEAQKYKSRKEFLRGCRSAFNASVVHGWLDGFTWLPKRKTWRDYTFDMCYDIAKTCPSRIVLKNKNHSAYEAARKNNWIDILFPLK